MSIRKKIIISNLLMILVPLLLLFVMGFFVDSDSGEEILAAH